MPARRRLLVATGSAHKLGELRALLDLPQVELLSLRDVGADRAPEPVEDARTFRGNALIKARYYAALAGLPTLADDSGLEVDALGGGPGVRTRRYAGEDRHRRGQQRPAAARAQRRAHGASRRPLSLRAGLP